MEKIFFKKKQSNDNSMQPMDNLSMNPLKPIENMQGIEPLTPLEQQPMNSSNISNETPINQRIGYAEQMIPQSQSQPEFQNIKNQPFQSNKVSNELPSFNDKIDGDDLLVPAPPPDLMEKKTPDFSINHLEEVERAFRNERMKSLDDYGYESVKREVTKPIFIKVENYEVTLKNIMEIKNTAKEFSEILFRIENINDAQNTKYANFHTLIEDIQRRLISIDNRMFENEW